MVEVKVPDIGDFKDVEVIEVLVKPGDAVAMEQSLVTVESDKASMEIPSSAAGTVKELKVKLGDKVSEGSPLLVLDADGAAAPAPAPAASGATRTASSGSANGTPVRSGATTPRPMSGRSGSCRATRRRPTPSTSTSATTSG